MIIISGTIRIKPEHRETAINQAHWMQDLSQQESGCITYRFYSDLEDPNLFRVFEEWEDGEALKAHFQTPHMAQFNQGLAQVLAEKPQITRYVVSDAGAF